MKTPKEKKQQAPADLGFVDPRKDHNDFVVFAKKTVDDIHRGKVTLDDLIKTLSYQRFIELAYSIKSSLYDILSAHPQDAHKDNIDACFKAFKTMDETDFNQRKYELLGATPESIDEKQEPQPLKKWRFKRYLEKKAKEQEEKAQKKKEAISAKEESDLATEINKEIKPKKKRFKISLGTKKKDISVLDKELKLRTKERLLEEKERALEEREQEADAKDQSLLEFQKVVQSTAKPPKTKKSTPKKAWTKTSTKKTSAKK